MRLGVALCALLGGLAPSVPLRAEPLRYGLRAEVGAEYDTNPARVERVEQAPSMQSIVPSPLGRLVLNGDLVAPIGSRQLLSLTANLAAKVFQRSDARAEDVAVIDTSGGWSVFLGGRTSLVLSGAYYDVFQRRGLEARDFRSIQTGLGFDQGLGSGGTLSAGVGYRWVAYKPEPDLHFTAPTAFAVYRHVIPGDPEGGADWEWSGGATAELRTFRGTRCLDDRACPGPLDVGPRRDQFLIAHLDATRTGSFLAGAGLAFHANLSNSFGQQLVRGLVNARTVVLLPWRLSLTARAELVFTKYTDSVPVVPDLVTGGALVSIEEESRTTMRIELVRPLGAHLDAGVRYTFYTNELYSGSVHYLRQTVLVFLAVATEP